jgi:uncharacterized protein (TIGR03086 family)
VTCHPTGRDLLRQAIHYALPSAGLVTPSLLGRPTPCAKWNLAMLLSHVSESLDALTEGLNDGVVILAPALGEPDAEPAGMLVRCERLLSAIGAAPAGRRVAVAGHDMTEMALTCTGAIEVSVHGWDIFAACGTPRPIPDELAAPLLRVAPALLLGATREGLFAEPLIAALTARPGERLLALLGRASTWR